MYRFAMLVFSVLPVHLVQRPEPHQTQQLCLACMHHAQTCNSIADDAEQSDGATWSFSSSLTNSGLNTSTRVLNCWPILMKVGPSLTRPSRTQIANLALRSAVLSGVIPWTAETQSRLMLQTYYEVMGLNSSQGNSQITVLRSYREA